jgi:alpha-glucoside transport system substrate-binding protein
MRRTPTALLAALTLITGTSAASCSTSDPAANAGSGGGTTLTVLTSWTTDPEKSAFQAIVNAFEQANPAITVIPQPTRSLAAALQSDVQQRTVPDLAVMPDAGALRTYANDGVLQPLSNTLAETLKSNYGTEWYTMMQAKAGKLYAVPVKVSLKSLIWYDRRDLGAQSPATWNDLMTLGASISRTATPWCLALADPPSSGWPGTDWIEDILLHQSGAAAYNAWVQGKKAWTSPEVTAAWQTWGDIVTRPHQVYGGATTALLTGYGSGDYPMFAKDKSPQCLLGHGALVTTSPPTQTAKPPTPTPRAGVDYDFFDFPSFGPAQQPVYEVSGDLMGIFHDSPAADAFIAYVAGTDAQKIWPTKQSREAFSANREATKSLAGPLYAKDKVAGAISSRLTSAGATLCFDASDLMPDAMTNAFYRAVLQYVQDPRRLTDILQNLDTVQADAYGSAGPNSPPVACAAN